jgi:hypothetical protein
MSVMTMDGGVVVAVTPYCQFFLSQCGNSQSPMAILADWFGCSCVKPVDPLVLVSKAKLRRLGRTVTRPDQAPCSCGSLVYLGFDYSDFTDMPSDVRRWVKVLRERLF